MDLEVSINAFGGRAPYYYKWHSGSTQPSMKLENPTGDSEDLIRYYVTVTDDCGNQKFISNEFVCNDICPDDGCIEVFKTGKFTCTDYCNDHPLYTNDIACDQMKVKCNCDDGIKRTVKWANGSEVATFIGSEAQPGSVIEHDLNTWDILTWHVHSKNHLTGCISKSSYTRAADRCGTGLIPWIFDAFGQGASTPNNSAPCQSDDDWEFVDFDQNECEDVYQCIEDQERFKYESALDQCKLQDPSTLIWATIEYCEETCSPFDVLNSTDNEPSISECPSCLPSIINNCDDPVSLFTSPEVNGIIYFKTKKEESRLISNFYSSEGVYQSSFKSERIEILKSLFVNVTTSGLFLGLGNSLNEKHYIGMYSGYSELDVVHEFDNENIIQISNTEVNSFLIQVFTKDKTNSIYYKYNFEKNGTQVNKSQISNSYPGSDLIVTNYGELYFIDSNNDHQKIFTNNDQVYFNPPVLNNSKIRRVLPFSKGIILALEYYDSISFGETEYTSRDQIGTLIVVFDNDFNLLKAHNLENRNVMKMLEKDNSIFITGYKFEGSVPNEEILNNPLQMTNSHNCGYLDIVNLDQEKSNTRTQSFNSNNNLSVTPNPSGGIFHLKLNDKERIDKIQVYTVV